MPKISLDYIFENITPKDQIDFFGIYRDKGGDFLVWRWAEEDDQDSLILKKILKPILRKFGSKIIKYISLIISPSMMKNHYAKILGVSPNKIILVNHHKSHAESAVFNLENNTDWLIFTVDAEGDEESGTVYELKANKTKKLTSIPREHSLGYFYTWITEYLGMKPNQHEFKVMGLEPYVRKSTKEYKRVYLKISNLFYFSGMDYKSNISMVSQRYKRWLKKELYKERFDNIAAATQKTFEFVIENWISNWVKKQNIHNVALSGGSFMNVKACQKVLEMYEVNKVYVVPSSGDETTVFGVCNFIHRSKTGNNLDKLDHLYLGVSWANQDIENWSKKIDTLKYTIHIFNDSIEDKVAELLSKGEVVARFDGKEEFGARALGNRSILSHPSNPSTIAQINKLIKDRDFWMPFTPSILIEDSNMYIKNEKNIISPFMSMTFNSTKKGEENFSAAIHPYDKTMRVQMVSKETNEKYYNLISKFKVITGISGLLNTSFNLHGEPNVHTPDDALRTLENSGLHHLSIGNILITKIHV